QSPLAPPPRWRKRVKSSFADYRRFVAAVIHEIRVSIPSKLLHFPRNLVIISTNNLMQKGQFPPLPRSRSMHCPRCNESTLHACAARQGTMVDVCSHCHGLWLDGGAILEFTSKPRELEEQLEYELPE